MKYLRFRVPTLQGCIKLGTRVGRAVPCTQLIRISPILGNQEGGVAYGGLTAMPSTSGFREFDAAPRVGKNRPNTKFSCPIYPRQS